MPVTPASTDARTAADWMRDARNRLGNAAQQRIATYDHAPYIIPFRDELIAFGLPVDDPAVLVFTEANYLLSDCIERAGSMNYIHDVEAHARGMIIVIDNYEAAVPPPQPPVNTVPGPQTTPMDTPLGINGFAVADPINSPTFSVRLFVTNGTATVLPSGTITGNGTNDINITGPVATVNAALGLVTFTPAAAFVGNALIAMTSNNGQGTDNDVVQIAVT